MKTLAIVVLCGMVPFSALADDPLASLAKDPNSPAVQAERLANKARIQREKEMRQIRFKYFRTTNNNLVRQEGILQLRKFDEPVAYKSLIDVFHDQGEDVQRAILDMFVDAKTDEGDAALAWVGIFGKGEDFRGRAIDRLVRRAKEANGETTNKAKLVVVNALRSQDDETIQRAATLSLQLSMFEAIPHLIPAQAGRTTAPSGDRVGDMAWILVGQQTAFVSDLTPVISQSSAAFDPQLDVVTDGTILRIQDAAVTTVYRPIVNSALQGLGSRITGQDLRGLGYDTAKWWEWYKKDYLPAKAALDAKASEESKAPGGG